MAVSDRTIGLASTLIPTIKHNQFQHYLEWLAVSFLAALIVIVISSFVLYCIEYYISRDRSSSDALATINLRMPMLKSFLRRHESLNQKLSESNEQLNIAIKKSERVSGTLAQFRKRKFVKVRLVNEPNSNLMCFSGYVYNDFVRKYVAKGQSYPLLDDIWAIPQLVEVWSESPERAEIEVARRYPKTLGFYLTNLEKRPVST